MARTTRFWGMGTSYRPPLCAGQRSIAPQASHLGEAGILPIRQSHMGGAALFSPVTPAKAGVQSNQRALATLDPGFRRDDGNGVEVSKTREGTMAGFSIGCEGVPQDLGVLV